MLLLQNAIEHTPCSCPLCIYHPYPSYKLCRQPYMHMHNKMWADLREGARCRDDRKPGVVLR